MINGIAEGKRIHFLLLVMVFFVNGLCAQGVDPDTDKISPSLREQASVVVRDENIELDVSDIGQSKLHVHRIETVLNEKGRSALYIVRQTDKFVILEDIEVKIYDGTGKMINKWKQHDFNTIAGVQEFIDDYKTYYLNIHVASYPVTIETDYRIRYKETLTYPSYQILKPEEGLEHSQFQARVKKNLGLRFREKNIHLDPVITTDGDYIVYRWIVNNLRPIAYEENAVSYENRYPSVILAPNQFKLGDYPGDMSTWKNFGLWYNDLLLGLDSLSDLQKRFYQNLARNAANDREKEMILYSYLQKNFRYVSIQLGIGGFMPITASLTDAEKYGDCKGLSNYMVAVLKSVGIKSYLALVNAESNQEPVDAGFPCNRFNHVVVCIPGKKDSIWLECTSKTAEFGVLGSFTENRNALLITEDGGVLVSTPTSKSTHNVINARTLVHLNEDGSGNTKTVFNASGEYKQEMMLLWNEKVDEQKQFFTTHWGFRDPGQISFDTVYRPGKEMQVFVDQQLEKIPELKTGNKMFLRTSVPYLWTTKLPKAENRQLDFYFDCPFQRTDTTVIDIPNNYGLDALPEPVSDSCRYARYFSKCWYDEKSRQVYTVASVLLHEFKIPANEYGIVKRFFDHLLMVNEDRIIIKKYP